MTSAWFAKVVDSGPVSAHPMVCSAKVNGASDDWFLDSCASHHVCGNRKLFSEFAEVKPMQLELGQGTFTITGCGTIELLVHVNGHESAIDLKNVYFVEGFKRNLIAIGKIDQAGFHINIFKDQLRVFKSNSRACSLLGKLDGGLYRVQGAIQYRNSNKKELSSGTCGLEAHTTSKVENVCENAQLWHKRFAHVDVNGLKRLNGDLTRMSVNSKNEVVTSKPLEVEKLSGFKVKSVSLENGKQLMTLAFQNYLNQTGILVKSEENNNQKVKNVTKDFIDTGYLVGYAMRKMGYKVWDPNSNVIYELNKVICNEQELFGNTRKTSNIQTEGNQEVEPYHDPGVSSDSEDDDVTPSAPITKQVSVKADDVNAQSTSTITMRQKSSSVSGRPPKGILRTPVMSKPGWERVE
uniref:GAG-pre-integrase domain-containing protein n=1 Tax=Strigamia maritima TaxID=126957 RepID=T1IKL6_STRMM